MVNVIWTTAIDAVNRDGHFSREEPEGVAVIWTADDGAEVLVWNADGSTSAVLTRQQLSSMIESMKRAGMHLLFGNLFMQG